MIIEKVRSVETEDAGRFAWSGLARYHNVSLTASAIDKIHSLNGAHAQNVKKQAAQIRQCLIQANEYRIAAKSVSLSTRPLLYYYSCMSLALAQILFKGSGNFSLDKTRGDNAHHGLLFKGAETVVGNDEFLRASSALKALPMEREGGNRAGTFELWHKFSRGLPFGGTTKRHLSRGFSELFEVVGSAGDERMDLLPSRGVSLLDCYKCLPQMRDFLHANDIPSSVVSANVKLDVNEKNKTNKWVLIVQPTNRSALESVYDEITFKNYRERFVDVHDLGDGCIIEVTTTENDGADEMTLPSSCQINKKCIYLYTGMDSLNEFGLFYVSIYILGNYARYYPDKWMSDVENYSALALSADELLMHADRRLALLTLSEFERCALICG